MESAAENVDLQGRVVAFGRKTTVGRLSVIVSLTLLLVLAVGSAKNPVLLVPGLGGSMLFADGSNFYCDIPASYIWVDVSFIYWHTDCFVEAIRLYYDNTTRTTHNAPKIDVYSDQVGSTLTISNLDPLGLVFSLFLQYYAPMIDMLNSAGYDTNNLRGAAYDFRKAPNEMGYFYDNLTILIEDMYEQNDNQPVVVIGHSMGNPVMLYYYNHRPQEWKDKYLKSHISLAGVWGGTVEALQAITSGSPLETLYPNVLRIAERSFPSINWLMPSDRFWGPDEVLVVTAERNYTSSDYHQLYNRMSDGDGLHMWEDTKDLIYDLTPPGIEFHCLYGYGVATQSLYVFPKGAFPNDLPDYNIGDGDGTVNTRSLQGCLRWGTQQHQPVYHLALLNVTHEEIISDTDTFNYIQKVLHLEETEG
ncbi:hypothetical protein ACOMHN_033581 [Nucella lapillus]